MIKGFVLVNNSGRKLSGFYPNHHNELAYRTSDYYIYNTRQEAQGHKDYITGYNVGKNLRITNNW